jgi:hypothetical protein
MLGQGPFGRPNLAALAGESGTSITPALFGSQGVVYSPIMVNIAAQVVLPLTFTNQSVFHGQSVVVGNNVIPESFINHSLFPVPAIGHELVPLTMPSATKFFAPGITVQATQNVAPQRFTNESLFFAPFVDTELKFILAGHFASIAVFHAPRVTQDLIEIPYTYPIGRQLDSDYGIRQSMTYYKQRLVLGSRYGRRR